MRRKKGSKVDGWLILDKPVDLTSTQAVNIVKRIFDA
ncbi:MAG TPA: tRNA pseudouridine(55) synthase TruB, partial [Dongiaceae bacterium]|nr:tRNA pseudouridine(55) synthase TruB [Dongiaceae bacterium]